MTAKRTDKATAATVRRGDDTAAARLRRHGWAVLPPECVAGDLASVVRTAITEAALAYMARRSDELVTTAAHLHDVYAIGSETFAGPAGSKLTAVEFPDTLQAARFAAGCMAEGIPARRYGRSTVLLLHEATP